MNVAVFPLKLVKYIVGSPHRKYEHKQGNITVEIDSNCMSVVCFATAKHLYNDTGFHVQCIANDAKFKEIKL